MEGPILRLEAWKPVTYCDDPAIRDSAPDFEPETTEVASEA